MWSYFYMKLVQYNERRGKKSDSEKILVWRRSKFNLSLQKKGKRKGKNSDDLSQNLQCSLKSENGGQNSTCWKIGVKILQSWQCLKKGGSIFYIRPQKYRSKFYISWKGGSKGPSLPVTQKIVSTTPPPHPPTPHPPPPPPHPPVFILRRAQGPDSI